MPGRGAEPEARMRLKPHLAAVALVCAAARGAAAQSPPPAPPAADPDHSETREVEVTVEPPRQQPAENTREERADKKPAAAPPVNTSSDDGKDDRNNNKSADDQRTRAEAEAVVARMRARRAANNNVATNNPAATPSEDQRAIELYRAHFGGQLTKAPYLGVSTSPVPGSLRQHLGLPEGVGLVVDFVEKQSPAESAGLKRYDILTRFNDQVLVNAQQLAVLVRSNKAGEDVKLMLIRGGKEQSLSAKLVEKDVKPLEDIRYWNVPENADVEIERLNRLEARAAATRQKRGTGTTVWRDNDMTLTLERRADGGRRLLVKEKSGRESDYDLNDQDARSRIPPNVAEKLRQMESKTETREGEAPIGLRSEGAVFRITPGKGTGTGAAMELERDHPHLFNNKNKNANQNDNNNGDDDDNDNDDDNDDAAARVGPARRPIGGNDLLNIDIRDVHGPGVKTTRLARVFDGKIDLPYLGAIRVEGLTEAELEKRIGNEYFEAKIAPSISVRVRKVSPAEQPVEHRSEPVGN